jgi:hypothetical protein
MEEGAGRRRGRSGRSGGDGRRRDKGGDAPRPPREARSDTPRPRRESRSETPRQPRDARSGSERPPLREAPRPITMNPDDNVTPLPPRREDFRHDPEDDRRVVGFGDHLPAFLARRVKVARG